MNVPRSRSIALVELALVELPRQTNLCLMGPKKKITQQLCTLPFIKQAGWAREETGDWLRRAGSTMQGDVHLSRLHSGTSHDAQNSYANRVYQL